MSYVGRLHIFHSLNLRKTPASYVSSLPPWFLLTPTRKAATPQSLRGFVPRNRNMAAFFFSSPIDIDIKLEGEEVRKQMESKAEKDRPISCPVYYDGESVSGQVRRFPSPTFSPCRPAVLRGANAGHCSCSRGKAYYARRNQSRVCGKHRRVYVLTVCSLSPSARGAR